MAANRKQEEAKKGAPEYMNTYGDLVTLLLCFFVLLFAMSTVDAAKFKSMAESFTKTAPTSNNTTGGPESILELEGSGIAQLPSSVNSDGENTDALARLNEKIKKQKEQAQEIGAATQEYLEENNISDEIAVTITDQAVILTFRESVLFDKGRANLKPEALGILDLAANHLLNYPLNQLEITGHADNDPINTPQFPNNWYLSSARAITVGTYLIDNRSFDPRMINAVGRGEFNPVAPNDTPENKAKNRRVEIKINATAL